MTDETQTEKGNDDKAAPNGKAANFAIQRIYVKDLSFEAPDAPAIFEENWKPELSLDVATKTQQIKEDLHEVVLTLTAKVQIGDKSAFVVEVQQAGLFTIKGLDDETLRHTLGTFCPNILFPYARAVIADAVSRGSFPQLHLAPINFDAIYEQYKKGQAEAGKATPPTTH